MIDSANGNRPGSQRIETIEVLKMAGQAAKTTGRQTDLARDAANVPGKAKETCATKSLIAVESAL